MYKYYFLPLIAVFFSGSVFAQVPAKKLLETAERQALRRARAASVPAAAKAAFAANTPAGGKAVQAVSRQLEQAVRRAVQAQSPVRSVSLNLDLRQTLLVAAWRGEPAFDALAEAAAYRPAARQVAHGFSAANRRAELAGMLSMNGWVRVLSARLEEVFTNRTLTAKMTREMEKAHEMAVKVYEQNYGVHNSEYAMYATPEFKDLLAEAMAQRLSDGIFGRIVFIKRRPRLCRYLYGNAFSSR